MPTLRRRPRREVAELVTYAIAVASNEARVSLHEFGIEGDRVRLVLSASQGELAAFMERLDEIVTIGSEGITAFWRPDVAYQAVELTSDEAVLDAMAQVLGRRRRAS